MVFKRMLFIAVIIIVINAILISPIYAMGNIISSGKNFLQKGYLINEVIDTSALKGTSNFIYNLFLVVAIVLAVGAGTVLGIKFIVSSVEGQAKIKEAIIPYIVGCIVIFAAFPIWSFIVDRGKSATGITGDEGTISVEGKDYKELTTLLINNEISVSQISDNELKKMYSYSQIERDLGQWVRYDSTKTKKEHAEEKLSGYRKEIYLECEKRGLL